MNHASVMPVHLCLSTAVVDKSLPTTCCSGIILTALSRLIEHSIRRSGSFSEQSRTPSSVWLSGHAPYGERSCWMWFCWLLTMPPRREAALPAIWTLAWHSRIGSKLLMNQSVCELCVHYLCVYSLLLILMKSDSVLVMCERVCVGVSNEGLGPPRSLLRAGLSLCLSNPFNALEFSIVWRAWLVA